MGRAFLLVGSNTHRKFDGASALRRPARLRFFAAVVMSLIMLQNLLPPAVRAADPAGPKGDPAPPGSGVPKREAEIIDRTLALEEQALVAQASADIPSEQNSAAELQPAELPSTENAANGPVAPTARRLQYAVSLSVRVVHDDNINISNTDRQADFYTAIEPRLMIGFGTPEANFLSLSYLPTAFIFSNHSEDNALQHVIRLDAQYRFPRLTLDLSQDVQLLNGSDLGPAFGGTGVPTTSGAGRVNLDVAARTQVNVFNTRLDANYSLTGKTFLTGGLAYSVTNYTSLIDSTVFSGNVYFNYTYSPKLAIGLGVSAGYDMVEFPSEDQLYEQLNARASYELTGKVSATATAGFEFRQYGGGDSVSPVVDATLLYQPFSGTNISLNFSRRTLNSATLAGQDYDSTAIFLGLQQRLFHRFFLGLNAGYESSTYFSTSGGISSTRDDNYYFLEPSIDFNITRFWTAGLYYLHRENNSSLSIFSFYDNQIGARSTLTF